MSTTMVTGSPSVMGVMPPLAESKQDDYLSFHYIETDSSKCDESNWYDDDALPNLLLTSIIANAVDNNDQTLFFVQTAGNQILFVSQKEIITPQIDPKKTKQLKLFYDLRHIASKYYLKYFHSVTKNMDDIKSTFKKTLASLGISPGKYDAFLNAAAHIIKKQYRYLNATRTDLDENAFKADRHYYMPDVDLPIMSLSEFNQDLRDKKLISKHSVIVKKSLDPFEVLATDFMCFLGAPTVEAKVTDTHIYKEYISGTDFASYGNQESKQPEDAPTLDTFAINKVENEEDKHQLKLALLTRILAAYICEDPDDLGIGGTGRIGHNVIIKDGVLTAYESGGAFIEIKRPDRVFGNIFQMYTNHIEYLLGKPETEILKIDGSQEEYSQATIRQTNLAAAYLKTVLAFGDVSPEEVIAAMTALSKQAVPLINCTQNNDLPFTGDQRDKIARTVERRCAYLSKRASELTLTCTAEQQDKIKELTAQREASIGTRSDLLDKAYIQNHLVSKPLPGHLLSPDTVTKEILISESKPGSCASNHASKVYNTQKGFWRNHHLFSKGENSKIAEFNKLTQGSDLTYTQLHKIIINVLTKEINNGYNPFDLSRLSNRILIQTAYTAFQNAEGGTVTNDKYTDPTQNTVWQMLHSEAEIKSIVNHSKKKIDVSKHVEPVRDVGRLLKIIHQGTVINPLEILRTVETANEQFGSDSKHRFGTSPIRFFLGPKGYRNLKTAISCIDTQIGTTPKETLEKVICMLADKIENSSSDTSTRYKDMLKIIENRILKKPAGEAYESKDLPSPCKFNCPE